MKHQQRGITLIESLVAFLVLSLGMLAVVRLQPELRQHAELARQRSEATRFAQQDIETLRSAAPASFAAIASAAYSVEPDGLGSPPYAVHRQVDATAWPHAHSVEVVVSWTDRSGQTQQVALVTLIGASDPSAAAALLLAR
jgi:Tfp pilus assembly protein PilV